MLTIYFVNDIQIPHTSYGESVKLNTYLPNSSTLISNGICHCLMNDVYLSWLNSISGNEKGALAYG